MGSDGPLTTDTRELSEGGERPASDPSKLVGRVLKGRYQLLRIVGEGGFGVVLEARDTRLDKRVAVKVLAQAVAQSATVVARFRQEAIAAARIGHKGIVDVTDADEDEDGTHFLVMEFIDGADLGAVMQTEGAFPVSRSLVIAARAAQALAAAHERSIIHRDLKPANIILTQVGGVSDFVKILDFGISKMQLGEVSESVTCAGQVVGTPRYMAPEQALGNREIDHRVDIYALGSILYEMVTGRAPYTGASHYEIVHNKSSMDPILPSLVVPEEIEEPLAVDRLIMKALARNPDERFASMGEFDEAIREVLARVDASAAAGVRPAQPITPRSLPARTPTSSRSVATRAMITGTAAKARMFASSHIDLKAQRRHPGRGRRIKLMVAGGAGVVAIGAVALVFALRTKAPPPQPAVVEVRATFDAAPAVVPQPVADAAAVVRVAQVTITLDVSPKDAVVKVDGLIISGATLTLDKGTTHQVEVSAPSYKSEACSVTAAVDGTVKFTLKKKSRGGGGGPHLPDQPL